MSVSEPLFTRVKWREGYDIAEVDAFVARLEATIEGRPVDRPVTADEIRSIQFTPVRFREGYDVQEVDIFLEKSEALLRVRRNSPPPIPSTSGPTSPNRPGARSDRPLGSPVFSTVRMREGYDIVEVDEFVQRVLATVNGGPIGRPVTADEIRTVQFTPVRFREGYDIVEVDAFLDEAEKHLR